MERPIWSTNVSSIASNSTIADLLDTGNVVLTDGSDSSAVIWQSFDHTTDTWLPKGWIGRNKITGEKQRLAPRMFSWEIDSNGNGIDRPLFFLFFSFIVEWIRIALEKWSFFFLLFLIKNFIGKKKITFNKAI